MVIEIDINDKQLEEKIYNYLESKKQQVNEAIIETLSKMVNRDNSRLEEDKYDEELEQNRLTIAKQVDEYYSGTSTLYTQKEADAKMQSFMNELKVKHVDS